MSITILESPPCDFIIICRDYRNQGYCESDSDSCEVAEFSVESTQDNNENFCGGDITCECWWNGTSESVGQCGARWINETSGGSCSYSDEVQSDCTPENLFLTYSWEASWNGGNESSENNCVGGQNVVPCPAQIQLPFFNVYNLIAVIVVIALIYVLLNLKKLRKKKLKTSRSKRKKK